MFLSLHRLLHPKPHPLDPGNLGEKARDVTFRVMEENDVELCLSLYRATEPQRHPYGGFDQYEAALRAKIFLTLIAMRDGKPVGCCSVHRHMALRDLPSLWFCYGMVDPKYQRQGVGTAQVLARMALLTSTDDLAVAGMSALPQSFAFYRRFGFEFSPFTYKEGGLVYHFGQLRVSQSFIDDCRNEMSRRNITCPDVRDRIPLPVLNEMSADPELDQSIEANQTRE
jgi:GNAT superfamily N-acetyltransferase